MVQVLCYKSSNVHRFSYLTTAYFRSNFKWMKSLIIFIPLPSSYLLCLTCIKTGVCINLLFNLAQSRDPVTHRLPAVVGAPFSPLQQSLADTEESDLWDHVTGPEQNTSIKKKKYKYVSIQIFLFFPCRVDKIKDLLISLNASLHCSFYSNFWSFWSKQFSEYSTVAKFVHSQIIKIQL